MGKAARRKTKIPRSPIEAPPAMPGQGCAIIYGHNEKIRKVLLRFSVSNFDELIFTPEEAEDVAKHLMFRAACARGEKPS